MVQTEYYINIYWFDRESKVGGGYYMHGDEPHDTVEQAIEEMDWYEQQKCAPNPLGLSRGTYIHTLYYRDDAVKIIDLGEYRSLSEDDLLSIAADMKCDLIRERDM